jgi:hypothetical protein
MKWLRRIGIGLAVLVVVLFLVLNFFLGSLVKTTVEKGGPLALGVPVKMESADFRLLRGKVTIKGFSIGSPEGFKSEKAISVGEVTVELVPSSVFSDTIVIKRIYVDAPQITYEMGLGTSNIGTMLDKLGGAEEKQADDPDRVVKKKVIIEDFLIENGKVSLAAVVTGGAGAPIPLPTVHLTGIGQEEGGTSALDVTKKVFGAIGSSITGVVAGAGKLAVDGAQAVGGAAVDAGKAVGGAAVDAGKAVGGAVKSLFDGE